MRQSAVVGFVLSAVMVVSGCATSAEEEEEFMEPDAAGHEIVDAVASGRAAFGGDWRGSWDRSTSICEGGGDQFRGYFEQPSSGDQDESERVMREVWLPYSGGNDIVRTDRPDGSMELLLRRPDGFVTLMTVTEDKISFIATSACFEEASPVDPEELLPQSEPGVTIF